MDSCGLAPTLVGKISRHAPTGLDLPVPAIGAHHALGLAPRHAAAPMTWALTTLVRSGFIGSAAIAPCACAHDV